MQEERRIRLLRPCAVSARAPPLCARHGTGYKNAATDALGCRIFKSKNYLLFAPCGYFSPL
jgi:hypothetical protein